MLIYKIKTLLLAVMLLLGIVGILYSEEQTCHYCRHAYAGDEGTLGPCDEDHYGSTEWVSYYPGKCKTPSTKTCEEGTGYKPLNMTQYRCVYKGNEVYDWEVCKTEVWDISDCEDSDP